MVSEPQLDNEVYASYNVTKDFSTYHGPGSTIIESTSTDSNIVAVASTYGSNSYLTLINKNVAPTNITIGIVGQEFNTLQDVKTGLNYSLNDSISIDGYAVDHYELLNVTVNISNSPPNITVTLSNELNCSTTATDADNDTITTTIEWYYNGTFNRTVNATSDVQSNMTGEHYCKARAYDQLNYSGWITSNTITINATINETIEQPVVNKPSSGGGGGSSYVPVEVNTTVNKTSTEVIVENNTEDNTTINTSQNTIDVPIEETTKIEEQPIEPIIEEPTTVINKYWIYFALFGLLFIISLFFIKKGVPIREDLTTYIKKLLDQGYEYKSIRRVLSKHYKQSEIDNHFHVLRRNNINPSKIQKEPKPFTKEVQDYIEKQKAVGYTEKEIMKVLKLQGYRH
jgi:DNA-binding transcriptional regulator YhcF (GntR family)